MLPLTVLTLFCLSASEGAAGITADEPIAGISSVTPEQLEEALTSKNPDHIHPEIAQLYVKWGKLFGIKADLAFAQMLHETNYLRYTGDVRPWQNNFAGIGATGGGNPGNSFPSAEAGVIAHYAHLAWYLFPNHVNQYCNDSWDPRHFGANHINNVRTLRNLGGKWAVPGLTYGQSIAHIASVYSNSSFYPPIIGNLDGISIYAPSQISLFGWAFDTDTSDPVDVSIYLDGNFFHTVSADDIRFDVYAWYLRFGANHGYSAQIDNVSPGLHTVCTYGINTGAGDTNSLLGCKVIDVPVDPFGDLNSLSLTGPSQIDVGGWTIYPDTSAPIEVHLYVNGRWGGAFTSDATRSAVGGVLPAFGSTMRYTARV